MNSFNSYFIDINGITTDMYTFFVIMMWSCTCKISMPDSLESFKTGQFYFQFQVESLLIPGSQSILRPDQFTGNYWKHVPREGKILSLLALMLGIHRALNSSMYSTDTLKESQFDNVWRVVILVLFYC